MVPEGQICLAPLTPNVWPTPRGPVSTLTPSGPRAHANLCVLQLLLLVPPASPYFPGISFFPWGIKVAELNPADTATCLAHLQMDDAGGGLGTDAKDPLGTQ